jgi:hypothetical protein
MNIQKNQRGNYDLTNVSPGKMLAILNAMNALEMKKPLSSVQADVRDLVEQALVSGNPEMVEVKK